MNKNDFLDKLKELTSRRKELLNELLQNNTDTQIGEKLGISVSTVRKHVQVICEYFGIESQPGKRLNRRKELKQLFKQYDLTDASIMDQSIQAVLADDIIDTKIDISYFSGVLPLDSPLYIRRASADDICEQTLQAVELNSKKLPLIKIRGAQFSGKSSLLIRLQDFAETRLDHVVAYVDLSSEILNPELFQDLDGFLKQFTKIVIEKFTNSTKIHKNLNLETFDIEDCWSENIAPGVNCTNCLERFLKPIKKCKTLLIDGLDIIADKQVEIPFLTLLRSWTQTKMTKIDREMNVIWCSIIITYSTGLQANFTSPLANVGTKISLLELNTKQILFLAQKYGLNWNPVDDETIALKKLIGGQPMLAHWAFYKISREQISIEQLKKQVIQSKAVNDPIINFLSDSIKFLYNDKELLGCIKKLMEGEECQQSEARYKLERSGLIKFEANTKKWQISCELYRQYFQEYLQSTS